MPAHCTATFKNASQILETRKALKNKTENISTHSALKAKVKQTGTREAEVVHELSCKLLFLISQYARSITKYEETNLKQTVTLHYPSYKLIATGLLAKKQKQTQFLSCCRKQRLKCTYQIKESLNYLFANQELIGELKQV